MKPDVEELKQTYSKLPNAKLIRIATEQVADLRPEAVEVLKEEINKRGLDLNKSVETQLKQVTEEELLNYCEILRTLPCPKCNSKDKKLNATLTGSVFSILLFSTYEKNFKIACPTCLDYYNNDAINKTSLLGWWAFPWGVIKTIEALRFNNKMKKNNHSEVPNELFRMFTYKAIGKIELNNGNSDGLQSLIENATIEQL